VRVSWKKSKNNQNQISAFVMCSVRWRRTQRNIASARSFWNCW